MSHKLLGQKQNTKKRKTQNTKLQKKTKDIPPVLGSQTTIWLEKYEIEKAKHKFRKLQNRSHELLGHRNTKIQNTSHQLLGHR